MNVKELLYSPPVIFGISLAITLLFSLVISGFSSKGNSHTERSLESYACGQRGFNDYVNPDYTLFFRFAFIFTVLHVLVMVAATSPKNVTAMPVIYILAGVLVVRNVLKR